MGAPAHTARVTPVGIKLKDGFSTTVAFAADPNVSFWEKTVKPPGLDGGDAIEQTTMHNVRLRTMASRSLSTMTPMNLTAAYDPAVYTQILALINVEGSITVHFPDGSRLSFFGFLQSFETQDMSEGEQPEADIVVTPTNVDPADGTEADPVMDSVDGT